MIVELTNLHASPDLYFTRKLGWEAGDPPADLEVPGWENLRFFYRQVIEIERVGDGLPSKSVYEEFGVRGDSIKPISEGKRVRSHATLTGELLADSIHTPGEWIAGALGAMANGITVPR